MAGHFSSNSRVLSKCCRNFSSLTSRDRNAKVARYIIDGSLKRMVHTFPKRQMSSVNYRNITIMKGSSVTARHARLLVHIQASGLHMTCEVSAGSDTITSESEKLTDGIIDTSSYDISINSMNDTVLSSPFDSAQDILTSGLVEPSLSSLGLGGYTPIGMIQHALEFAHVNLDLPWWGAIVCGTILFRILTFPLMIKGQVNAAKLNAVKPELDRIQQKIRESSNLQNPMIKGAATNELQQLYIDKDVHPLKAMIVPLVQIPLFVSFFIGLRRMCVLPIESMKTGGILWFPDLTMADPYYLLPVISAATMLLIFEMGAESMVMANNEIMKNVFRGMTIIIIPLTISFPTAILTYWVTTNCISVVTALLLKQPTIKKYLKIPGVVIHPTDPNVRPGGFLKNLKTWYKNAEVSAHVKSSEKMKERRYKSSLEQVYQETFDYNPRVKENEQLSQKAKQPSKR